MNLTQSMPEPVKLSEAAGNEAAALRQRINYTRADIAAMKDAAKGLVNEAKAKAEADVKAYEARLADYEVRINQITKP